MKKLILVELLSAYAEDLITGGLNAADYVVYAAQSRELAQMLKLTDEIAALLVPVIPAPGFVRRLGSSLAAAAEPAEIIIAQPARRRVWLGALLSGSLVSAVGVLAWWWMRRGRGGTLAAG